MSISNNIKTKFILSIILSVGFIIRVCGISFRSFFADEVFVIRAIQQPFSSLFSIDALHGPLPYYILHFWSKIFGFSEFWMRMPSVLFGVLTCYLIYKIAMELTDKKTALIAATISALSPFLILYDQTARWYSLFTLASTASIYFFTRYMKKGGAFNLLLFFISTLALLYTETIAVFVIAFELLAAIIYFRKWTLMLTATFSGLILLSLPWMMVYISSFRGIIPENFVERGISGGVAYKLIYLFYSFTVGQTISPFNFAVSIPAAGLFFSLALFGTVKAWKNNRNTAIFLFLFLAATLAQIFTPVNLPHYMMYSAVPLIIILSIGIKELKPWFVQFAAIAAILIIYGYSLHNLYTGQQYNRMEFMDNWKGVASYVQDISGNEDLIIHSSSPFEYYCDNRKNKTPYGINLQEIKDSVTEYFMAHPFGRVILVYSPLSGLFVSDRETGQRLEKWLCQKYYRIGIKDFSRDPDYNLKRRFVKRSFPEFRISVSSYSL